MDDVEPLLKYWHRHPPAHIILGAVHIKPKQKIYTRLDAERPAVLEDVPNGSTEAELLSSGMMTIKNKDG